MTAPPATVQRWRTLVLIYPVLDARYGSGLSRRRARRVMTREERDVVGSVLDRLPATVFDWSSGLATLEPLDIVEPRRPLTSLSSSGGGRWWVGPREVRPELTEVAGTGARYDSVYALWPGDPDVPQCGWGCTLGPSDGTFGAGFSSISTDHWRTLGPSDGTFGAGFSSISTDHWRTLATDPDPEQGYVHEWLHQVESVYRGFGVSEAELPGLHDAAKFTSRRPTDEPPFGGTYAEYHDGFGGRAGARTWSPWYRDWMTGGLRPAGDADALVDAPIGLTPARWALRG